MIEILVINTAYLLITTKKYFKMAQKNLFNEILEKIVNSYRIFPRHQRFFYLVHGSNHNELHIYEFPKLFTYTISTTFLSHFP